MITHLFHIHIILRSIIQEFQWGIHRLVIPIKTLLIYKGFSLLKIYSWAQGKHRNNMETQHERKFLVSLKEFFKMWLTYLFLSLPQGIDALFKWTELRAFFKLNSQNQKTIALPRPISHYTNKNCWHLNMYCLPDNKFHNVVSLKAMKILWSRNNIPMV
jgi:hypothetical protein